MGHYIYIQAKTLLFVHSILVMGDRVEIRIFIEGVNTCKYSVDI